MATNESCFKKEFRDALENQFGEPLNLWTNNDMFRSGLPDFSALFCGRFFAIEAKYVKAPPARPESKVLSHELTAGQASFLRKTEASGGYGVVLIGFADVAVAVPFSQWGTYDEIPNTNITLERVRFLSGGLFELSFPKKNGVWNVSTFFERIIACTPSAA